MQRYMLDFFFTPENEKSQWWSAQLWLIYTKSVTPSDFHPHVPTCMNLACVPAALLRCWDGRELSLTVCMCVNEPRALCVINN